ncbi:MAG: chromosome segregation protein SMC [Candidatus Eisenbacteria bacterium]
MYLKKIEIFGFKSFMNKLELQFGDGFTAVIGPNGCGKSNISDAIRWVLGEQNARLLRGETMDDVIFNGTRSRKPLGMAEVSLHIDNEARAFSVDYPEIRVTRRVYRSGVSEYLINKQTCRLKDVKGIFMDTGLGNSSYLLLERGMIDTLLGNTTVNLRLMLEEAAGIMKYKTQEKIALRKLDATEGDLLRIRDIVAEVEKRVRALKRQIGKAKRHNVLTAEIRNLSLLAGRMELERLGAEERDLKGRRESAFRGQQEIAGRLAGIEAEIERDRLVLREKETALTGAQKALDGTDQKIERIQSELLVLGERESGVGSRQVALEQEIREGNERIRETALVRGKKSEEFEAAVAEIRGLEEDGERKKKENRAIQERVAQTKAELLQRKQQHLDLFVGESEKRNEVGNLETRLANLAEREETLAARLAGLEKEEAALAGEAGRTEEDHESLVAEAKRLRERRDQSEEALENARAQRAEVAESLVLLQGKRESLESTLRLLLRLRREYEGYRDGVRSILRERPKPESILGVVAELIEVDPPEYLPAFENALGDALQCVLVGSEGDALDLLGYLREGEKGWATILPRERFGDALPDPPPELLGDSGVIGPASAYVRPGEGTEAMIRFLIAEVIFVRDLDTAIRLSRDGRWRGFRFITSTGEGARFPGVIFGGGRSGDGVGIYERRSRIAELEAELKEASIGVERMIEVKEKAEAGFHRCREERAALIAELDRIVQRVEEAARERARRRTSLEGVRESAEGIRRERSQIGSDLGAIRNRLESMRVEMQSIGADGSEADRSLREIEAEMVELELNRDDARRLFSDAQVALAEAEGKKRSIETELSSLGRRERELGEEITRKREELAAGGRILEQTAERREALRDSEANLAEEREKETEIRDEVLGEVNRIGGGIREREDSIKDDRKRKETFGEEVHAHDMRLREIDLRRETIEERSREEFDVAPGEAEDLEPPEEPMGEGEIRAAVADRKDQLRRLGPVNLVALDEFDEENERYEFLRGQEQDLLEARDSLRETIRTVDRKARTLFGDTFDRVRLNFRETFEALFEGGEADLTLADPDEPLMSEIEVTARPGNKRPQKIALLSSGERALTAIAILFALYLEKPSPFCILDELDAPLDDANVGRFLAMLQRFTDKTQFVVITHNRLTMEAADYLYGVTMEEAGVSRAVSVRLGGATLSREEEDARIAAITGQGELGVGLFDDLRRGLKKTREGLVSSLRLAARAEGEERIEEMEEALIRGDVGVRAARRILERIEAEPGDPWDLLREEVTRILAGNGTGAPPRRGGKPHVVLLVGTNGSGKTTTAGKLAAKYAAEGKQVVLAAADTFRAAAIEQLEIWGKRTGAAVIRQERGADAASVAYDALASAIAREADVLLVDTAGRLQTRSNLMEELKKIRRVLKKHGEAYPQETLLVLDATTGQNAVSQAKLFGEAVAVDGIVLTKLDGTARGGVILSIREETDLPVLYVGVGESVGDLMEFSAEEFARALLE